MVYSIGGNLNGKWQHYSFDRIADAVEQGRQLNELGVMPVHYKKDGKRIETTEELNRLLEEEQAADANRT